MTQAGMMLGTPNYMSPEQFESGRVDRRINVVSRREGRLGAQRDADIGRAAGDDQLLPAGVFDRAPNARIVPRIHGRANDVGRFLEGGSELGNDGPQALDPNRRDDRGQAQPSSGDGKLHDAPSRLRELELPKGPDLVVDQDDAGVVSR